MKKYFLIFKMSLEEFFIYRLNFLLWRFRNIISLIALVFFWQVVYSQKEFVLGYQKDQILGYVVLTTFLRGMILSSKTADLAGIIRSQEFAKFLLQPIGIFKFWLARDFSDKAINTFFAVLEVLVVVILMNSPFYFPPKTSDFLFFVLACYLSLLSYFFISFLSSITGFWIDNVWATRWLLGVIFLEFFSGVFFPLNVLPSWLLKIVNLTPFPYLIYFPIKIYLGHLSNIEIAKTLFLMVFWLAFTWYLAVFLWKRGLKRFSIYGG